MRKSTRPEVTDEIGMSSRGSAVFVRSCELRTKLFAPRPTALEKNVQNTSPASANTGYGSPPVSTDPSLRKASENTRSRANG